MLILTPAAPTWEELELLPRFATNLISGPEKRTEFLLVPGIELTHHLVLARPVVVP